MWIDNDGSMPGDVKFLVRSVKDGVERYALRDRPLHTNRSHEPILYGFGGETDNVARYAEGLATMIDLTRNGDRMKIARVENAARHLETLGWPELTP